MNQDHTCVMLTSRRAKRRVEQAAYSRQPTRRRTWYRRHSDALKALLFLLPALGFFAVFKWYPMVDAIRTSLYHETLTTPARYAGFANYRAILHDSLFHHSIVVSLLYLVGVTVPVWVAALALALVFNQPGRTRAVFRTLFFLPTLGSVVAVALVWSFLYNPRGLINASLATIGIAGPNWVNNSHTALLALIIMGIWQTTPYFMIIYLAGLKSIPVEYYEAGALDGVSRSQSFRYLTLPLLKPTFALVVVYSMIASLRNFVNPYLVTGGGPANATTVLPLYNYQTGLQFGNIGYASALTVVYLVMMMILVVFQLRLFRQIRPAS